MPTIQTLLDEKGHDVATIHRSESILDAAKRMNELRIGALVIVNDDDSLAGIFTERDILMRVVAREVAPCEARVEDYMTRDAISATPETTIAECGRIMTQKRIRHLPVVSNGKVVGLVSIGDLTRFEMEAREETIQGLKEYMHGGG